ncbi:chaperon, small heat shock protein Hsp20 [Methanocella conradii HZ254]|uniref:Chaperon, small heat shock protein Hsp20 n=1 Tax=Methanocella conradii (strain DSM 24694 / JCM 17849 / CGMCC 1.5162 / HZ254) TaxID=1041930 RepID=H8I8E4_METCZ|nr:archaeal heat shock protein Hsp20 [Methanocella conradii]AFC98997.1 chaperon, small heat shock protein Hsp20 [Methanocella conradii HZ254]MDI6896758.1 Hsp20/alpha crystallin family protein [Methanocella conradii]
MARRRNPFDIFSDFEEMFEEMLREFEKMGPGEHISGPFFYGFSINQRPGEEPEIREFGNIRPERGRIEIGERKPLVDVFDTDKTVQIVAEMPGIEKEDVELNVEGRELEIKASRGDRKYHEFVELPADVDIDTARASYKNGVLDITLNKVEKNKGRKRINVE